MITDFKTLVSLCEDELNSQSIGLYTMAESVQSGKTIPMDGSTQLHRIFRSHWFSVLR